MHHPLQQPTPFRRRRVSGRQIGLLRGHHSHATSVDCARKTVGGVDDGMVVLSGSYDCSALLWDLRVGVPIRTLLSHTAPVTSCCIARDGATAITAGMDRVCRGFDVAGCHAEPPFTMANPPGRSKHLRMLKCAAAAIARCRLSPDGGWLATAAQDGLLGLTKVGLPQPLRGGGERERERERER
jgi:WD40 repeat protein